MRYCNRLNAAFTSGGVVLLSIVAILLMPSSLTAQPRELAGQHWPELVEDEERSQTPHELSEKVRRLVVKTTPEKLQQLINSDDVSISLAAAWERVRRGSQIDGVAIFRSPLPGAMTQRFVGFVEGRIKIPIPWDWERTVLSGAWDEGDAITFRHLLEISGERMSGPRETSRPVLEKGIWRLVLGDRRVDVPDAYIRRDHGCEVIHEIVDEATYFILYDQYDRGRGVLHRLDSGQEIPKWRAAIMCTAGEMNYSGKAPPVGMWIEDSVTEVAVFTASLGYFSVEVYEKETGRNVSRFLSDCLNPR